MNLIPEKPIQYPLILSVEDLEQPEELADLLAAVAAYRAQGPADEHVVRDEQQRAHFEVEGSKGRIACITTPGIGWVGVRGLGRKARLRISDAAGSVNILGEQVAARIAGGQDALDQLREDAAAIVETMLSRAVMREENDDWRLVLQHPQGLDPAMARDALVRQLAFVCSLMVKLPGAAVARRRLAAQGADTSLLDGLLAPITEDALDAQERAALAAHRKRSARMEAAMVEAATASLEIGQVLVEGRGALDLLDRAPATIEPLIRQQILTHAHRLSMSGKAQPPSGRLCG